MTEGGPPPRGRRPHWRDVAALPGRRLFVAVPLPDDASGEIAALVERLRVPVPASAPRRGADRDVRWVRLDGLHLTLRFLGPTPEDRVAATTAAVGRAAEAAVPFDAVVAGGGAFPSPHRPRTLWLAVTEGAAAFAELARTVDAALVEAGWPSGDRPFRPHVTLARSDGIARGPEVAALLIDEASRLRLPFRVDRIVLFESITGGGPARYAPLETAVLHGRARAQ